MSKTNKRKEKAMNALQLNDFGTPELRQHGPVIIESKAENGLQTVTRARKLTPIEVYHGKGLLSLAKVKDEDNDAALAAALRFFTLWHRYHAAIGTPKTRSTLSEFIDSGLRILYENESDADIQREITELKDYVGRPLYRYVEAVAGEGWFAEEICGDFRCNANQYMHMLRIALAECVAFWDRRRAT